MTSVDAPDAAEAAEPPAAPTPPARIGWPTWLRRTLITLALLAAGFGVWKAAQGGTGDGPTYLDSAVVKLFPGDGAQALRQTQVGADLAPGYDGRLTINGIAIPEEQMVGAQDPATMDPDLLAEQGVRPNNRNSVYFQPGPGKVIEEFDTGTVTIQLSYFKDRQPDTARTVSWTIRVD